MDPARNIPVSTLGGIASRILDSHESGRVLAVFRRSFYLQFDADVVCVGPKSFVAGPLSMLCVCSNGMSWQDCLAPDAVAHRRGGTLQVGSAHRFDFSDAKTWHVPAPPAVQVANIARGLRRLTVAVQRRHPVGLGVLVPSLCGPASAPVMASHRDPLLSAAVPTIEALRSWMSVAFADSDAGVPDVSALVGLGPGLTPSGDDFICGVLAALHFLRRDHVARRLAGAVVPVASTNTNLISAAYLRAAAQGEISQLLIDVLTSLCAGGEAVDRRLDGVQALGHTSGWDCLAGVVAACAAACTSDHERRLLS
jgi:hypothetical protein